MALLKVLLFFKPDLKPSVTTVVTLGFRSGLINNKTFNSAIEANLNTVIVCASQFFNIIGPIAKRGSHSIRNILCLQHRGKIGKIIIFRIIIMIVIGSFNRDFIIARLREIKCIVRKRTIVLSYVISWLTHAIGHRNTLS